MMSEWQPIETAPKDGSLLVLYLSEDLDRYHGSPKKALRYCIGYFELPDPNWGREGEWVSVETREETLGDGSGLMTDPWIETMVLSCKPSHWMPLPEHPAKEG